MFEVFGRTVYPYRAITYIEVTWPDGTRSTGSGVVVGINDVLTAAHVVYNLPRGGFASAIKIYPGADTVPYIDAPFGSFGNGWRISSRSTNWDRDGDGLLIDSESQYDFALIGLYERLGDFTGWLGTRNEQADGLATMLGYPGRGTGLMAENVFADASNSWGVYDLLSGLGKGSSGGPLVRTASNGETYVVGVASSGNAADTESTYAALFGPGNWDWLVRAMADNDDLLRGTGGGGSGSGSGSGSGGGGSGGKGVDAPLFLIQTYLAYFGRPVDATGMAYLATQTEAQVVATFDASRESQDLYGLNLQSKINAIYKNLFNRDAEANGLQYWTKLVASGQISAPAAALTILKGALGTDALAVQNKLAVSNAFSLALDTAAEAVGYAGLAAAQSARSFVAGVSNTVASFQSAIGRVDAAVAAAVAAGKQSGKLDDVQDDVAWASDGAWFADCDSFACVVHARGTGLDGLGLLSVSGALVLGSGEVSLVGAITAMAQGPVDWSA